MIVVINAYSARIGGGKTYVRNLLANLPEDPALRIHLFAHPDLDIVADPRIHRPVANWPVKNPITRLAWEKVLLPRYLRAVRADILFCPGGLLSTRAPKGCRTATMFRNMLPFDASAAATLAPGLPRLRNQLRRRVMLRSLSSADLSIFISDYARRVIERQVRVPNPVTIPHGIAPQFRTAGKVLARPAIAGKAPYVLYVSRFEPYKHHLEVVQAFAALPDAVRGGRRLLLAGEIDRTSTDPANAHRVQEWVEEHGLTDRIVLLGGVPYDELPALNAHADLILFASACENCPNILLESLAAGRPVISSEVMPMPEFGGPDLIYFDPSAPTDIARAMTEVLTDPVRAAALAAASAERSLRYDWAVTAERTWQALNDTVAGRMAA